MLRQAARLIREAKARIPDNLDLYGLSLMAMRVQITARHVDDCQADTVSRREYAGVFADDPWQKITTKHDHGLPVEPS